ncbi:Tyrosine recombinase XerD [Ensifer sp. M14]|uniref:tyrosine-type recombinase/integrase n=1 Tax=Ensifer sp. M14 TaxID=2203782 RepID=UPI000E1CECC5|nr:tyrosine-type recombinase/integrase [Ensifer sp. M14]RDL51780.1 Tyrosine recombinase XerD [Ensifer sp. M14]
MALKLMKRKDSPHIWIRGSVRGLHVYESTKTSDEGAAETIRILRERELLDESIFGKKISVTFEEAARAYLDSGGSTRFLSKLTDALGTNLLRKIKQNDLDLVARRLYPDTTAETRNRQCYTPFIAVWNHAVGNEWADFRKWKRPRKAKGTVIEKTKKRSGDRPVDYELAATFVSNMSPAPAMVMTALFYTGMRPIELFTLEGSDVDIERRWIALSHTKTGEPRGVPMHDLLVPLFSALIKRKGKYPQLFQSYRGEPYQLFENRGGQLNGSIRGTRERLAKAKTPIRDISPYTARHTVSTQLVINGVHPHIKDQILGHAINDMSRHYTNVPQAPLIEAINTLPVPQVWRDMWWWSDPLGFSRRHIKWGAK